MPGCNTREPLIDRPVRDRRCRCCLIVPPHRLYLRLIAAALEIAHTDPAPSLARSWRRALLRCYAARLTLFVDHLSAGPEAVPDSEIPTPFAIRQCRCRSCRCC